MQQKITHFIFEKSTKNTHKFTEDPPDGSAPIIGTLYVQKHALPKNTPQRITVQMAWEE